MTTAGNKPSDQQQQSSSAGGGGAGGQQQQQDTKTAPPQLREVTLKSDHEHAGVPYKAGEKIKVEPHTEEWLRENKIID